MKKYFSSYWIRSAFYTFLQRFSLTIFGLVNFIILIRTLSHSQMGTWALFLTVTAIFEMTKTNLLKNAHIRYVSSQPDEKQKVIVASSSFLINSLITAVFICLIFLFADSVSQFLHAGKDLALMLKWFVPGLAFMVLFSHLEAVQQSFLDFKGCFAGYFTRQLLFLSFILGHFLLKIPFSLAHLALYQSISIMVGTIFIYAHTRKYLKHQFSPKRETIKEILGYGGYIFGSGLISNINGNMDQMLIARFLSPAAVAFYNAASRICSIVDIPSYAATEILFPKLSQAAADEQGASRVQYLYEKMVAVLLCFTIPTTIFIFIFPHFVIDLVAGSKYAQAALILQIYMFTGLFKPLQNQAANLLNSIGKPGKCFWLNTISFAIYLCINIICLIKLGFYGAAIGGVITNFICQILWYRAIRKEIDLQFSNIFRYMKETYTSLYLIARKLTYRTKSQPVILTTPRTYENSTSDINA